MGNSTSLTKKQIFLAGVVCSLIVLRLVPTALYFIEELNSGWSDNYELALLALGTLLYVLVLLKFLLPIGASHRLWLGCLLGALLLVGVLDTLREWHYIMLGLSLPQEWVGFTPTAQSDLYRNNGVLLNPFFWLLLGIVFDRAKMQKIAGVLASVFLALRLFVDLLWWLIDPPPEQSWQLLLTCAGYIILFFTWPVLSRPILDNSEKGG